MKKAFAKTLRRVSSFGLVLCLLCCMIPSCLAVSSSTIDNILFDASYYAANNADVVKALGSSTSALRGHYDTYGKKEGRAPSDLFNPQYYLSAYPDLKAAFGNDYKAAYTHFVTYGISEGRQGSPQFSVEIYKNNYADLRNAFGTSASNNWKYLQHWVQYGRKEGRVASSAISASSGSSSSAAQTQGVVKYVKTSNPSNGLYMRSGPSTSYSAITKLAYGTQVQVLSTTGSWSKISANGKTGYVATQYLSSTNPNGSSGSTSSGLVSPVSSGKFSQKTDDNGWYGYHDINRNVSTSTAVYAITSGTAYFYQYNTNGKLRSYGNYVRFVSSDGQYEVRYAHLSRFNGMSTPITADTPYPCSGAASKGYVGSLTVSAGTTLGWVGTTGNSSGVHLHIEIYKNGTRVDPTSLLGCTEDAWQQISAMLDYGTSFAARVAAENDGQVVGGGLTLLTLCRPMRKYGRDHQCEQEADVVIYALEQPLLKLAEAAGFDGYEVFERVKALAPNQFFSLHQVGIENSIRVDAAHTDYIRVGLDLQKGTVRDLQAAGVMENMEMTQQVLQFVKRSAEAVMDIAGAI